MGWPEPGSVPMGIRSWYFVVTVLIVPVASMPRARRDTARFMMARFDLI